MHPFYFVLSPHTDTVLLEFVQQCDVYVSKCEYLDYRFVNLTYVRSCTNKLTGHSLGGSLASLLGVTFGAPVVTFQAPSEKLAASRLHLPSPVRHPPQHSQSNSLCFQPSTHHVTHVIHTADPIAMGTCNGVTSVCALGGYAMETRCISCVPCLLVI
jgi:putative lipase involved disintegration of autophagic bodies